MAASMAVEISCEAKWMLARMRSRTLWPRFRSWLATVGFGGIACAIGFCGAATTLDGLMPALVGLAGGLTDDFADDFAGETIRVEIFKGQPPRN